jgi:GT2 family glycosyltransferase
MAEVSVVIPNYNQRNLLDRVLRDLSLQQRLPEEVVVVDNGSNDDSVTLARKHGVRVIEMGSNQGFSRAVNRGVREARGEVVAILNNDVELDTEWLARLLDTMETTGAWFATGKILQAGSTGTIDGTYDEVSRAACAWRCGEGRPDGPLWSKSSQVSFASFTAALFRKELFRDIGFLDESFNSYLEDVDFGLRCAVAGRTGVYVPEAIARHRGSATLGAWSAEKVRLISRNQLLLVAKHYPRRWWLRLGWAVLVGQLLWGAVATRHGAGWAYWKGKLDGFRMFSEVRRGFSRSRAIEDVLTESESRIRRLQRAGGYDWYWRVYFALT